MKWFKRKLRKWINEAEEDVYDGKSVGLVHSANENRPEEDPVLNFRIYNAINGQILEFRHYDRKTDRSNNSVYLIPKDQEIGEYINKCLSVEMMK